MGNGVEVSQGTKAVWRKDGHMDKTEILLGRRTGGTDAG